MEDKTLQGRNPEFSNSLTTEEAEQPKTELWAVWGERLSQWNDKEAHAFSCWECLASMSSFKEILKSRISGYGYSGHAHYGDLSLWRGNGRGKKLTFVIVCFTQQVVCDSFVTPWTVAYQAPLSMGFSRQEYWSGLPFPSPRDLPDPGFEPMCPAVQVNSLPLTHLGSPIFAIANDFWAGNSDKSFI